jgi:osmoprotectant transport system ATP-binding protein
VTGIRFEGVTKTYETKAGSHHAVRDVTLTVHSGECLILVGGSGSGKTTLLKMINRLIEPSAGRVLVGDRDTRDFEAHLLRRRIGYAFQEVGLFPHLRVSENIAVTPRLLGWSPERQAARVDELLELVELPAETFRSRMPSELSGGQQQRVGLARALAGEPDVLLLDEPFGALDPLVRERLQQFFMRIREELATTVVFVTPDMVEALVLGDRIAVMDEGELLQLDTPRHLLQEPNGPRVAELLAAPKRQAESLQRLRDDSGAP